MDLTYLKVTSYVSGRLFMGLNKLVTNGTGISRDLWLNLA